MLLILKRISYSTGRIFYPHITLYQGEFDESSISYLVQKLTVIAKDTRTFTVRANTFSSLMEFIFLNAETDENLMRLQKYIYEFVKTKSKSLSPVAGEIYVPHITITRLQKKEDCASACAILGSTNLSFSVPTIFLANLGPDGTVNEIYKEIPFG